MGWPADQMLPIVREFVHEGRAMSVEHAAQVGMLIDAAARLDLPVLVETLRRKRFAHGGNVVKADFVVYRITIGGTTQHEEV